MEQNGRIEKPMIAMNQVKKRFESAGRVKEVVDTFNLDVKENEFVVLFGPGQCGKTTLINLIAGLELPTEGEILVDGKKWRLPGRTEGWCIRPPRCSRSALLWEMWNSGRSHAELIRRQGERGRSILLTWWGCRDLKNPIQISSPAECASGWESQELTAMIRK